MSTIAGSSRATRRTGADALQRDNQKTSAALTSFTPPLQAGGTHVCHMGGCENVYHTSHPRDISLQRCLGEDQSTLIRFAGQYAVSLQLEKLRATWNHVQIECCPMFHSYIYWMYALRVTRIPDDRYALSIVSVGPPLAPAGDPTDAHRPPGLTSPMPESAEFVLVARSGEPGVALPLEGPNRSGGYIVTQRFSRKEISDLTRCGNLRFQLELTVDRAYFDLAKLVDVSVCPALKKAVPAEATVDAILAGGLPDAADWEITGGDKATGVYHVHKEAFARAISALKVMLATGNDALNIELLKGGSRGRFRELRTDEQLRMAICIAYGAEVPFPTSSAGLTPLHALFRDRFLATVVPQWERDAVNRMLAYENDIADRRVSEAMGGLRPLLDVIFGASANWFPVARRVAIGMLADVVHFTVTGSVDVCIRETILPYLDRCEGAAIRDILSEVAKVMETVPRIAKRALAASGATIEAEKEYEGVEDDEEDEDDEDEEPWLQGGQRRVPCNCSVS